MNGPAPGLPGRLPFRPPGRGRGKLEGGGAPDAVTRPPIGLNGPTCCGKTRTFWSGVGGGDIRRGSDEPPPGSRAPPEVRPDTNPSERSFAEERRPTETLLRFFTDFSTHTWRSGRSLSWRLSPEPRTRGHSRQPLQTFQRRRRAWQWHSIPLRSLHTWNWRLLQVHFGPHSPVVHVAVALRGASLCPASSVTAGETANAAERPTASRTWLRWTFSVEGNIGSHPFRCWMRNLIRWEYL